MAEPDVRIRRATADDANTLSSFAASVFAYGCPPNTKSEDLADYIAAELTGERFRSLTEDPKVTIYVAETADGLCGYALIVQSSPHAQIGAPAAELRKLYVAPAHHGNGVADALMRKAMTGIGGGSQAAVWLSVFSGNPRAVAFYKKWGFRIVGTQEFLVGTDRQRDYLMRRDATPGALPNAGRAGSSLPSK